MLIRENEVAESIPSSWCSKTVLNACVLEVEVSEN